MKKFELDTWQKQVMEHEGDILLCTGRRVGKTFILARKAVKRMMKKKQNIIVTSLTEDQAELIIQFALSYAKEKYPAKLGKGKKRPQLKKFWLNGSVMMARAVGQTGNSTRGFEGGVLIVDEASRMPAHFWAAATPVILMTGGELWLASTPAGKTGYFWERFNESYNLKDPDARFKVFYKPTPVVIQERKFSYNWTEKQKEKATEVLRQEEKTMSKLEYGQEYLGLFMEDLQQFFPDELIKKCQTQDREGFNKEHTSSLGVDLGRLGDDESAFSCFEFRNEHLYQTEQLITKKLRLTEPYKIIVDLDKKINFTKIFIDSGGIGVGVFDWLLDNDQTKRKVEGLDNSKRIIEDGRFKGILKTDLYWNLRYFMENEKIHLLKDHSIFMSLKMIQYEETYDKQGQKITKIFGRKGVLGDHVTEAIVRAAWIGKQKINKLWFSSISV